MKLIPIVDADIKLEGDAEYLALTGFNKQEVVDAQMLAGITLAEACLVFMTLKTCCTVEEMMVFWRCILGQHRISHGSVHARFIGALSLLNDKLEFTPEIADEVECRLFPEAWGLVDTFPAGCRGRPKGYSGKAGSR